MRSKILKFIPITLVVILGLWWFISMRDNFVFRDLRRQIAQIEHKDYIESVSVARRQKPISVYINVRLIPGVTDEMLMIIVRELTEKVDEYVHYGVYKNGAPNELFPARLTLFVGSFSVDNVNNTATCEREIISEDGNPVTFEWSVYYHKSKYSEVITRPYEHPGLDEWYGR